MSDQLTKERRTKRFHDSWRRGIKRYKDVLNTNIWTPPKYTRQFEDRSWFTCGNSRCLLCANPRKIFSQLSLKERSDEEIFELENRDMHHPDVSDDTGESSSW